MKSYIDKNTQARKLASDDFEKDLYKLLNNAVYGKTLENMRDRIDVKLVANPHKLKKLVARPTYKFHEIINEELVMVNMGRKTLCLNKPIYAGFSILELSKTLMFDFHYNVILNVTEIAPSSCSQTLTAFAITYRLTTSTMTC